MENHDVIVVGVGGMGSAAVFQLAARGVDVLGLEQYDIPHTNGSSHGVTRIIRKGQHEHPAYVPLVRRAYDHWTALESRTGRTLMHVTGGITIGSPNSQLFSATLRSCKRHDVDHEVLSEDAVNERFPAYELPHDQRAVYEPDSGFLVPEQCLIAHVEAAHEEGAEIRAREPVQDITPVSSGRVRVATQTGTYEADRLVVTAGAWTGKLLPTLSDVAVPVRQVLAWFQPTVPAQFDPEHFPVFAHATGEGHYYGSPRYDVPGFKVGRFDHLETAVDPDEMDRRPQPEDEAVLRSYVERYVPDGVGPTMRRATCMYTNTPDKRFILDTHPDYPQIVIGAGFSGHGFKFASVIGEILADFAVDEGTDFDVTPFRLGRF